MPIECPWTARKWRRNSVYGDGLRVPLTPVEIALFRAKLLLARRPRRLTQTCVRVGEFMARTLGDDGRLEPSVEEIAKACQCARSTAHDCLRRLKAEKFLDWDNRIVRNGWRVDQTTNAYRLRVPPRGSDFPTGVPILESKRRIPRERPPMTDEEARINASRQLAALGMPTPSHWPLSETVNG
jgi:hypothetical protein